ncbi:MAG: hypothetical protein EAZ95_08630 [Bacteroidetes bacterium]|nr:MAG: hypothetical protein EAZ95_08630 [Bacteroidota bacterium]
MKTKETNFLTLFWVALSCILMGGLIGAMTNAVNGWVSPYYFQAIMGWSFPDIWGASIAQGIFEGILYGLIFSIVFTTAFAVITKNEASFSFAYRILRKIVLIVLVCWCIGGVLAMLLATLSSSFYKSSFPATPQDFAEMLRFAWVGGSIWGGIIGSVLGAIIAVFTLKNSWSLEANPTN